MQISFYGYMDITREDLKKLAREHELPISKGESPDEFAVRLCNTILDRAIQTPWTIAEISNHELDDSTDYEDENTRAAQW